MMAYNGSIQVSPAASYSSGLGLVALIALIGAPALSEQIKTQSVQISFGEHSSKTGAVTIRRLDADAQLKSAAADAFRDLLQRQSEIEPDIAALVYAKRSELYSTF